MKGTAELRWTWKFIVMIYSANFEYYIEIVFLIYSEFLVWCLLNNVGHMTSRKRASERICLSLTYPLGGEPFDQFGLRLALMSNVICWRRWIYEVLKFVVDAAHGGGFIVMHSRFSKNFGCWSYFVVRQMILWDLISDDCMGALYISRIYSSEVHI